MEHRKFRNILGLVIALVITSMLGSCCKTTNPSDNDEVLTVIARYELDTEDIMDQVQELPDAPNGFDYHDLYYEISQTASGSPHLVAHEVVKYTSKDDQGNDIELSGLFIYPLKLDGEILQTPLVSYNHGTELMKKYAPSKWDPFDISEYKNFMEVIVAHVLASFFGWSIIMPDYQGMGYDLNEPHPYCIREKLAAATADMVEKGINMIKDNNHDFVNWDGHLFVYGYSEGGFVTMAVTQELEDRNIAMTGSVCMDGPYDLSGTMLDMMIGDEPAPVPYYLPLMLVGYNNQYPETYVYDQMLKEPYRTDVPKYATGFYDEDVVNGIMPASHILKEIFEDAFVDSLNDSTSVAWQKLYENDTYQNWIPETTMLMWHCQNDDCVPIGNYEAAKAVFAQGGAQNITFVEFPPVPNWAGTVHVSAAPIAFLEGALWIKQQLE